MKSIFFSSVIGCCLYTLTLQSCQKADCTPNNPSNNDSTYVDTTYNGNNPSDSSGWNGGNGNNPADSTNWGGNNPGDSTGWNGGNGNSGGNDPSDSTNWNPNDSLPG